MPDISMCNHKTCPSRMECYRSRAKPDIFWQSYSAFKPDESGKCKDFVPLFSGNPNGTKKKPNRNHTKAK